MTGPATTEAPEQEQEPAPPSPPANARRRRAERSPFTIFSAVLALVLAALILYPVARTVTRGFYTDGTWNFSSLADAYTADWLPGMLFNTLLAVGGGGLLALVTASLFAWLNERTNARLGVIGDLMPLVPLLLPNIALAIGWIFLATPNTGFLNHWLNALLGPLGIEVALNVASWPGLIFMYALYFVPYVYLIVATALRNVDPWLEEASRASGAGLLRTFWRVSLPSIRPALLGALLLVVMVGMALFSVPVVIATRAGIDILSVRIIRSLTYHFPPRTDEAVALSLFLLVSILAVSFLYRSVSRRGHFAQIGGKGARRSPVDLGPWRWPMRALMFGFLLVTSVLPMLAVLIVALQPYWSPSIELSTLSFTNFTDVLVERRTTRDALRYSLTLGVVGGALGMTVASILALYMRRRSRLVAQGVESLTKLPAAFSNIIVAVGFLIAFSGAPFHLSGTLLLLLLAYFVIYLPEASIAAGSAMSQVGGELSEASAVSGASEGRTFRKVVFPLTLPGLASGWALLFVLMAGELSASALLAGAGIPVIGYVILDIWDAGQFGTLAALAFTITIITSTIVLLALTLPRFVGAGRVGRGRRRARQ